MNHSGTLDAEIKARVVAQISKAALRRQQRRQVRRRFDAARAAGLKKRHQAKAGRGTPEPRKDREFE